MAGPMSAQCQAVRSQATELLLLGDPLPAALTRHLAGCEECAAECEGVRRVVRTFERAEGAPSRLPAPTPLPTPAPQPTPAPLPAPTPLPAPAPSTACAPSTAPRSRTRPR
ncbi:hypothetical protein ABT381_26115, partial [Streptomyces sp. NPDC000151]